MSTELNGPDPEAKSRRLARLQRGPFLASWLSSSTSLEGGDDYGEAGDEAETLDSDWRRFRKSWHKIFSGIEKVVPINATTGKILLPKLLEGPHTIEKKRDDKDVQETEQNDDTAPMSTSVADDADDLNDAAIAEPFASTYETLSSEPETDEADSPTQMSEEKPAMQSTLQNDTTTADPIATVSNRYRGELIIPHRDRTADEMKELPIVASDATEPLDDILEPAPASTIEMPSRAAANIADTPAFPPAYEPYLFTSAAAEPEELPLPASPAQPAVSQDDLSDPLLIRNEFAKLFQKNPTNSLAGTPVNETVATHIGQEATHIPTPSVAQVVENRPIVDLTEAARATRQREYLSSLFDEKPTSNDYPIAPIMIPAEKSPARMRQERFITPLASSQSVAQVQPLPDLASQYAPEEAPLDIPGEQVAPTERQAELSHEIPHASTPAASSPTHVANILSSSTHYTQPLPATTPASDQATLPLPLPTPQPAFTPEPEAPEPAFPVHNFGQPQVVDPALYRKAILNGFWGGIIVSCLLALIYLFR